jgi:hypothetical protein
MVIPRRVAFLGIAAVLLAGAGIAAAATHDDDDDGGGTPTALEQPSTTTSVLPPDTSTTIEVTTTSAPPTTVGATTTTRRGATTTTTRQGAITTRPPAPTTTGAITACTAAQIEVAVTTDKASYAQDERVNIRSTLRNRSSSICTYTNYGFTATILSPAGATITSFTRPGDTSATAMLGPGQQHEATVSWDRVSCAPPFCTQSTPGTYSVAARWEFAGGPYTARRPFNLT